MTVWIIAIGAAALCFIGGVHMINLSNDFAALLFFVISVFAIIVAQLETQYLLNKVVENEEENE